MKNRINVGVNIFLVKDNKLLLGLRKNVAGDGEWGLPGGHVEEHEKFSETASRELKEETGLIANKFKFENIVNQPKVDSEHYIQIGMSCLEWEGEVKLMEPEKCSEWKWFDLNDLPENIFFGHKEQIKNFLNKKIFFE
jgi:8-oxo-dGTP diphosphatase